MRPRCSSGATGSTSGPTWFFLTARHWCRTAGANNVELVCRNVTRVVKDQTSGKPLTLLDDITLVIRPREFVCLLGPSGSGKSTLLSALSARVPADSGHVSINGEDLYASFDALKQDIAVVPQKDVLHDLLTVKKALHYTAQLRLPPDTSGMEVDAAISEMLSVVGLSGRQNTRIRYLSGGQIKRASLANEIISRPSLLFLDEVTSGLDEQTDREIMSLFRQLADGGKTVVCVTHSLANVERACNLLVVLTPGGKLAFVGSPAEALAYFGIDRLGEVYERLSEKSAEEWKEAFRRNELFQKYVQSRLPSDNRPPVPPAPRNKPTPAEKLAAFPPAASLADRTLSRDTIGRQTIVGNSLRPVLAGRATALRPIWEPGQGAFPNRWTMPGN